MSDNHIAPIDLAMQTPRTFRSRLDSPATTYVAAVFAGVCAYAGVRDAIPSPSIMSVFTFAILLPGYSSVFANIGKSQNVIELLKEAPTQAPVRHTIWLGLALAMGAYLGIDVQNSQTPKSTNPISWSEIRLTH